MFEKKVFLFVWTISFILLSCDNQVAENKTNDNPNNNPICFVSILPQAYLVEKIAGDLVHVEVLVGPGQSPETYEPVHKQLTQLSRAKLFFAVGVPFEQILLKRMSGFGNVTVVNTLENIPLLDVDHHHHHHDSEEHDHENMKDFHVWLDPILFQQQSEIIGSALMQLLPQKKEEITANLSLLKKELIDLDVKIRKLFEDKKHREMWVYHPAYSYFCDRYDLEQVSVEIEGKEPSAKDLANLIARAKKNNVAKIFVQQQFMGKSPQAISREIGCEIISIDPLAYNYSENLLFIAQKICQSLK